VHSPARRFVAVCPRKASEDASTASGPHFLQSSKASRIGWRSQRRSSYVFGEKGIDHRVWLRGDIDAEENPLHNFSG